VVRGLNDPLGVVATEAAHVDLTGQTIASGCTDALSRTSRHARSVLVDWLLQPSKPR
jgi:hypothetical protein